MRPSIYQTTEAVGPKEMDFSPGISCWENERHQPEGVIVSKRNSQLVRPLQDVPEAQTTMGQWWSGDHTYTGLLNHAYPLLSI